MKLAISAALALTLAATPAALAKDLPPRALYEAMLEGNKDGGWVSFRNIDGKQILYFSALQTLHCRLSEIRYSINSTDLDKTFDIVPCNSQNPWALPPDSKVGDTAIFMRLGSAQTVAVQVVWEDGVESDIMVYKPCDNVGDQTCVDYAD